MASSVDGDTTVTPAVAVAMSCVSPVPEAAASVVQTVAPTGEALQSCSSHPPEEEEEDGGAEDDEEEEEEEEMAEEEVEETPIPAEAATEAELLDSHMAAAAGAGDEESQGQTQEQAQVVFASAVCRRSSSPSSDPDVSASCSLSEPPNSHASLVAGPDTNTCVQPVLSSEVMAVDASVQDELSAPLCLRS